MNNRNLSANVPSGGPSRKVYVISLGCPKNLVDTERFVAFFGSRNVVPADTPEEADFLFVNTCGFINDAKKESIDAILEMADEKNNEQKLIVAGCLVDRYRRELEAEIPEVDLWMDLTRLDLLDREMEKVLAGFRTGAADDAAGDRQESPWVFRPRTALSPKHTAYLKISEGCDRLCAFCSIPSFKGRQKSVPMDRLLSEAVELVSGGAREVTLIGQDTVSYGKDLKQGTGSLRDLLTELNGIEGLRWIRLLYTYPTRQAEDLRWCYRYLEKLVPYLDLPLQHLSDPVLQRMKRGTPYSLIREHLAQFREVVPGLVVRSTCIVGFPGETERDYDLLKERFNDLGVDHLGVFAYSDEEGTSAYNLEGKVDEEEIERRYREMTEWAAAYCQQRAESRLGDEVEVLVDGVLESSVVFSDRITYQGRTAWQAPEIDGAVLFSSNLPVEPGNFVRVKLEEAQYPTYGGVCVENGEVGVSDA